MLLAPHSTRSFSDLRPKTLTRSGTGERRQFEVVVCEVLHRVGRKLAHIVDLFDHLSFLGIKLYMVSEREVTALARLGGITQLA